MKDHSRDLAAVLYLAHALPLVRRRSEEAAALLEAAILECAVSLSNGPDRPKEDFDVAAFLNYVTEDIGAISPLGAGLLHKAIGVMGEPARPRPGSQIYMH